MAVQLTRPVNDIGPGRPKIDIDQVVTMWNGGATIEAIAAATGKSPVTIKDKLYAVQRQQGRSRRQRRAPVAAAD